VKFLHPEHLEGARVAEGLAETGSLRDVGWLVLVPAEGDDHRGVAPSEQVAQTPARHQWRAMDVRGDLPPRFPDHLRGGRGGQ